MKCENNLCIYFKNNRCVLYKIKINSLSMCEECIIIDFTEKELIEKRKEAIRKIHQE